MLTKILHNSVIQTLLLLALLAGVGICIFPEYSPLPIRFAEKFAVQIMIGYLFGGVLFLMLKQPRLMFASFGCCAALAIFLKFSMNPREVFSEKKQVLIQEETIQETESVEIKIAHFSLSDAENDPELTFEKILETEADLISIQEVTPIWQPYLESYLDSIYPHNHTILDLGMYGLSVYSKYAFNFIDTFYYEEIPNLVGSISLGNEIDSVYFVSTHAVPAFSQSAYKRVEEHLQLIQDYLVELNHPHFIIGNFYVVPWSKEVKEFRSVTKLRDSRTGFMPSYRDGTLSFWDIPMDHIFFSKHFECSGFKSVSGVTSNHIGIQGVYTIDYVEEKNQ
ncbi:MAG: hypothetical protein P1U70_01025 [Saprospiraceae bacterium]|jgi:endonuclease/exonuclease/phosphatase (EEP) superfamily protein YafD|nr:hypothetical protein [Saprospiraceae bacterium]